MPKRTTGFVDLSYLESAPLPQGTSSYTVIPHKMVNDKVMAEVAERGFEVEKVLYKASANAQIATGIVLLKQGSDQEMKMMLGWSNSYDKSMRFKCAIGGYLPQSESTMVSGSLGNWGRKHTGKADMETLDTIKEQLEKAELYYNNLLMDKMIMKDLHLDDKERAKALGLLYFKYGLLSGEQTNIIKNEIKKPSVNYNADDTSLWVMYCHIILALHKSHPKRWLDQQILIHNFITDYFRIQEMKDKKTKDPKQLDLVVESEKAEAQLDTEEHF